MGIKDDFSSLPEVIDIGVVTGSYAGIQLPDIPCKLVMFKAKAANVGTIFLGDSPNELHWGLAPGDQTNWIPMDNLNNLYQGLSSGTSDQLVYWREY